MNLVTFLFIIGTIISFTLFIITLLLSSENLSDNCCKEFPTIYCIMITGHTPQRSAYARLAIENFHSQVYPFKHLLIINQSSTSLVRSPHSKVTEIILGKTSMSLGALRNYALDRIPKGAYFTTWDDDDWRSSTYLLEFAYIIATTPHTIPALSARYEYNIVSGLAWTAYKPKGFVLFCAPNLKDVRYLDKPTMEDLEILDTYRTKGYKVVPLNNMPNNYIRLVHGNNTSLYVDINKNYLITNSDYYENPTTAEEKALITKIMTPYRNV